MNDKELNKQNRKKWFKKWWGILLIVFCPYLLFLVIFQSNIDKKKKIVFSSILTILIVGVFLGALLEPSLEKKIAIEKQKQEQLKKLEKEKMTLKLKFYQMICQQFWKLLIFQDKNMDNIYR